MNSGDLADVTINDSPLFKYKSSFLSAANNNGVFENVKIAEIFPLKYLNNFCRSLEVPLINCKIHLE